MTVTFPTGLLSALQLTGDLYVKWFLFMMTGRLLPSMALTYTGCETSTGCALVYFTFVFSPLSFCAFLLVYLPPSITQHSQLLLTAHLHGLFFTITPFKSSFHLELFCLGCVQGHWPVSPWTKGRSEFQENKKLFIVSVQIIIYAIYWNFTNLLVAVFISPFWLLFSSGLTTAS